MIDLFARGRAAVRGVAFCKSASLPTETHFHIGAFDRAGELKPTRHVFREEHLPWFAIAD